MTLLALFSACATPDPCEGVRDLTASPEGLTLVREEHTGWGSDACFQCHQRWRIHAADCLDGVAVEAFDAGTPEDCVACHGANGVSAWQDDSGGEP